MELRFTTDPAAFLDQAGTHLGRDPVLSTVVATRADQAVRDGVSHRDDDWYLTVLDGEQVVGVAMRTAPFAPRPAFVLPMPEEGARLAARTCHERGEELSHVNGALPAARTWLEETARLGGGVVRVDRHTRLFEAREVVDPPRVPGSLRAARADDVDLVEEWFVAFHRDIEPQASDTAAGRDPRDRVDRSELLHRIASGRVWLWEAPDGRVVHLSGVNAPALGAARVGPVYTPPTERGRGWASAAVAEVTRRLLAVGARPCLFTDQANPTSNAIYQAIGYRPVVDMADLHLLH